MDFEQDYIMRMVKEIVKLISTILFNKKETKEWLEEIKSTPIDDLYIMIIKLADKGQINAAENLLFSKIDKSDINQFYLVLAFYEHINEYTDEFLAKECYKREEIIQGINDIAKEYGISEMLIPLLVF